MDQNIGTHTQTLQSQTGAEDRFIRRRLSEPHTDNHPLKPGGGCSALTEAEEQASISQDILEIASKRQDKGKIYINLWHDPITAQLLPEIVSQIFIFVACADSGIDPLHYRHYTDHPVCATLLLARVCQRWRDIALSTPQLWTDIGIDIWKHASQLDITKELLLQSRSLSLNLTFYQGEDVDPWMFIAPEQDVILDVIRSHSARWKLFIELDSEMYEGIPIIHDLVHKLESMPTSDCLELRLGAMTCQYSVALPKPLRPRVFHSFNSSHSTLIPLQWDNLTHLEVASYGASDILAIVRQAPRLTEMRAECLEDHYMDPDGPNPSPITPVTHSGLRILASEYLVNDGANITDHLTLPSLQHLDLDNTFCQFDDLIDFLNRSKLEPGSLQMFRLKYDITGETYDHRFIELAALTNLVVFFDRSTWPRLLHSYLSELSEPSSLPHLRHLAIHVSYDFDHVSPSPASWALLSGLCQATTLNDDKATVVSIDPSPEELTPAQSTTDKTGSSKADTASLLLPGTRQQWHKRPLESLSFQGCSRPDKSSMEKEVVLRFLEVQRTGVVKLTLIDKYQDDVLKTMADLYGC